MFQGFSQQTNDFLWGIRFNNERSWFEAHKQEYLDYVQSPLRQLAQEVYARFSAAHEELPLMVRVVFPADVRGELGGAAGVLV